jgi:hypothetical protein
LIVDPILVALQVAEALEACRVRYLIGGSLASSMSGEPRATLDIDMVVALTAPDIQPFVERLGQEFYSDVEVIRRAVEVHSSANILHYATSMKVDLFMMGGTLLDAEQMSRRLRVQVFSSPDRFLYVYTPEDILLQKLRWYRLGGETSDRQWRDVLGIVRVQAGRMDAAYLRRGATILGVEDLLAKAMGEG